MFCLFHVLRLVRWDFTGCSGLFFHLLKEPLSTDFFLLLWNRCHGYMTPVQQQQAIYWFGGISFGEMGGILQKILWCGDKEIQAGKMRGKRWRERQGKDRCLTGVRERRRAEETQRKIRYTRDEISEVGKRWESDSFMSKHVTRFDFQHPASEHERERNERETDVNHRSV